MGTECSEFGGRGLCRDSKPILRPRKAHRPLEVLLNKVAPKRPRATDHSLQPAEIKAFDSRTPQLL
ncbi:MAG: hypothetical protein CMJ86_06445 [Planctomycetes bacterium]|nr:hypothetical protein [Planctomycetota bacterium]